MRVDDQAPGGPIRAPRYILNWLIWLDQGLNVATAGDPDETVSSRLGRLKAAHGGTIPWTRPLSRLIAWGLERIDPGHCADAVEPGAGDDGIADRPSGPLPHEDPPPLWRGGNEGEPEEEV